MAPLPFRRRDTSGGLLKPRPVPSGSPATWLAGHTGGRFSPKTGPRCHDPDLSRAPHPLTPQRMDRGGDSSEQKHIYIYIYITIFMIIILDKIRDIRPSNSNLKKSPVTERSTSQFYQRHRRQNQRVCSDLNLCLVTKNKLGINVRGGSMGGPGRAQVPHINK